MDDPLMSFDWLRMSGIGRPFDPPEADSDG